MLCISMHDAQNRGRDVQIDNDKQKKDGKLFWDGLSGCSSHGGREQKKDDGLRFWVESVK